MKKVKLLSGILAVSLLIGSVQFPVLAQETVPDVQTGVSESENLRGTGDVLASGTCDDLAWTLTEDGTLTISGTGDMEDDW